MGSQFFVALLTAFCITIGALAGAGYSVTLLTVPPPRDVFRTGFFEFEIAPGWECDQDGTEYVCQTRGKKQKGSIAIIAMKERKKDMDSLEEYETHLKKRQPLGGDSGASSLSVIAIAPRRIKLGQNEWVESLHCGSEIQNYCTYYLGTVTSHLGVLVTMSYREGQEATYLTDLSEMMKTIHVYQR
jgi:hypothetical protein